MRKQLYAMAALVARSGRLSPLAAHRSCERPVLERRL